MSDKNLTPFLHDLLLYDQVKEKGKIGSPLDLIAANSMHIVNKHLHIVYTVGTLGAP